MAVCVGACMRAPEPVLVQYNKPVYRHCITLADRAASQLSTSHQRKIGGLNARPSRDDHIT
ncbi:uncharacterized protein BDCG_17246 [Blastomyces dermatitidis ER-3]|uniref:Uncharacterized protein n=1 Tax=Ajellomyces dermatitidis (strain ER-3 / ATCC MYA-2586) TaxID=559297 RepID=A0ABX2VXM1_AJEDR|nr:uncharacterized protein BDCG_17246 [Blastomyces dermatitidis ER-3]OAT01816.1 hypothetical protein BDCG_17246 [Blastomyces dermatitidis ER-3]